jgi:hypothetical protein
MLHFRENNAGSRTQMEVWEGDTHAATIFAQAGGLNIITAAGYSVQVGIQTDPPTHAIIELEQQR